MNNATLILHAKAANNIPLDEELHTFAEWKRFGFQSRKAKRQDAKLPFGTNPLRARKMRKPRKRITAISKLKLQHSSLATKFNH